MEIEILRQNTSLECVCLGILWLILKNKKKSIIAFREKNMATIPNTYDEYLKRIEEIKKRDEENRFSKNIKLDYQEKILDKYMNKVREKNINRLAFENYPPAVSFNKAIKSIREYYLFEKIFAKMPCGGNLHIHTSATWNIDKFIDMLKKRDDVYVYWNPKNLPDKNSYLHGKLYCFSGEPKNVNFINLKKVKDVVLREEKRLLTFIDDRIEKTECIWDLFNDCFKRVNSIMKVENIYKDYYTEAFKYQYANGNDYIEIRAGVSDLKANNDDELKGDCFDEENEYTYEGGKKTLEALRAAYYNARKTCEDLKVKVIVALSREYDKQGKLLQVEPKTVETVLPFVKRWKDEIKDEKFGNKEVDFVIGFDLVSEEDRGHKTDDYAETIINTVNKEKLDINFYFHDGETNLADNRNMHSAYVLGTKRIGHGINAYNFPFLMESLRKDNLCLEVCPISNQLLRYTTDLRIHPVAQYLQRGVQCVVCSDDPQIFDTAGTYYDLWEVYLGSFLDLRDIKALILNSYEYSAMTEAEKKEKENKWEEKWKKFIADVVKEIS